MVVQLLNGCKEYSEIWSCMLCIVYVCMCAKKQKSRKFVIGVLGWEELFLPENGFTHPAMNLGVNLIDCCISLNAKATYPSSIKNWKRSGAWGREDAIKFFCRTKLQNEEMFYVGLSGCLWSIVSVFKALIKLCHDIQFNSSSHP